MSKIKITLAVLILMLALNACTASATPAATPTAELIPTTIVELVYTPTPRTIPLTEANLPRVSVEKAKAASESGAAIVVDVRSKDAYDASHIPGAINIPLQEFETNPTGLGFDQNQWIITYCT